MLHKIELNTPNVVGYRWEGKFDQMAFKEAVNKILPELTKHNRFNIYMEIVEIEGVEAKALWKDLKFSFQHMGEFRKKIKKIALVSDKEWIRNLSDLAYVFVPDIKLKSFSFDENDAALAYAEAI